MNTPTSIGELTQSAPALAACNLSDVDAALMRLAATHNQRVHELEMQRDELARCLREAHAGFVSGRFVCVNAMDFATLGAFTLYMQRCWAALSAVPPKEAL